MRLPMVWRDTGENKERIKFIGDWLKSEFSITDLCARYQISRKTGYKLINRYECEGEKAFMRRSSARHSHPNATCPKVVELLLKTKMRFRLWGPAKIRDYLLINRPEIELPAASTIGDIFKLHGLVKPRRKRFRVPVHTEPFATCDRPNAIWSADFKGQFKLGSGEYCYPLTISDNYSRYLLSCHGLTGTKMDKSIEVFDRAFREYGLPKTIRTDNGHPFACTGLRGLTRLSAWWVKLGIMPERTKPGRPDQNGRHERMHRTLKDATAKPSSSDTETQQISFDRFRKEYNEERPHQALNGERPADIYTSSLRQMPSKIPEIAYPDDYKVRKVRSSGEIKWKGNHYYITQLLHREPIGLKPIDDDRAMIYFASLPLGVVDSRKRKINRL